MDKNAIKKFAVWAREELQKRVTTKAEEYEISDTATMDEYATTLGDRVLSPTEQTQRGALIRKVREKGFDGAIEEAAYTWFNRFIALRFMEVNGYLPTNVRVFTDEDNRFKPQILDEALHMELEGLQIEKVMELKEQNQTDALYKYLMITQCNALHKVLPKMFPRIDDYTELLFPDHILREGSVIEQMIAIVPEADWEDAVQILGWLYQFYNTEPKAIVDKQKTKITKEQIPAATQLFTPDWIVRYMVENSIGRIAVDSERWAVDSEQQRIEKEKEFAEKMGWKYFLPEPEQTEEVQKQITAFRMAHGKLEELKIIDPCMGSGHILVYAFDALLQIYEEQGYSTRDAVASILENNLFGLDLDERAYQLAYFALKMKARSFDRRFLTRNIEPAVYCPMGYAEGEEYGSLVEVNELEEEPKKPEGLSLFDTGYDTELNTWNFRSVLNQKYDVVITNPPYKGSSDLNATLGDFVKKKYPDSKSDLFAVFIERCLALSNENAYIAMITMHSWMFLSSYEKLRGKLIHTDIVNMAHLGARAFEEIGGEVVQTTAWVMRKHHTRGYKGAYKRLVDFNSQDGKQEAFLAEGNLHTGVQGEFEKIPGSPIAYWVSEKMLEAYKNDNLDTLAQPRHGLATSDNARFLKLWFEVDVNKCSIIRKCDLIKKWFPMNKGGSFRKWYGNLDWLINYEADGKEIKDFAISIYKCSTRTIQNTKFYFRKSLTWSALSSGNFSVRWSDEGALFGSGGYCAFVPDDLEYYILALMNSKINSAFMSAVSPTLNYEVGHIKTMPIIQNEVSKIEVDNLVAQNIALSKTDWDAFETSWDFVRHPLLASRGQWAVDSGKHCQPPTANLHLPTANCKLLADSYNYWEAECQQRFAQLKANEEALNRIFINIYGLQDELTPEVADKDVTVRLADQTREVKSLIGYAVGCMLGRYSLDCDGLAFAGGEFDSSQYQKCVPQKYAILPICDDEYFQDDIVKRFIEFIGVVYGAETLEENLDFVAEALGGKGNSREVIRKYFLNGFYADHCKIYQKRPIYWQFDSGKKNGFKALVYLHRYQKDTIARIRTDYVHEQQSRYRTAIADLERRIDDATTGEKVKLGKQLTALKDQDGELRTFEEKIHHLADQMISIDLDDGVKNNYAIFGDVLSKIK